MEKLLSCEFNIDTADVELRHSDGSMVSIAALKWCMSSPIRSASGQNWIGWSTMPRWTM